MLFIISLILAVFLVTGLRRQLHSHPGVFCAAAAVIFLTLAFLPTDVLPLWAEKYILGLFRSGAFPTALWCIVMFAGALPAGKLQKCWMSVRGEISLVASILTLCHTAAYGIIWFQKLMQAPESMTPWQIGAAVCSVIMLVIMLPLAVLSIPPVRRAMPGKLWKQIQRAAYVFYALIYVHVMLLMVPQARLGRPAYQISAFVYTLVFLAYALCRIQKLLQQKHIASRDFLTCAGAFVLIFGISAAVLTLQRKPLSPLAPPESADAAWKDGTYRGTANGYDGNIIADVTIENGEIVKIEAISEESFPGYFEKARGPVISHILRTQHTDADAVSGATYSSHALAQAVADAVKKAQK